MTPPTLPSRPSGGPTSVFGEPLATEDGATVIPVSRVRDGSSVPAGVFVIRDGRATWTPAIDADRIARIGVMTGFMAATLACLAVLRRPPWPDLAITIEKRH